MGSKSKKKNKKQNPTSNKDMDKNNDNFLNTQLGLNPYLFHKLATCLYEKLNSSTSKNIWFLTEIQEIRNARVSALLNKCSYFTADLF